VAFWMKERECEFNRLPHLRQVEAAQSISFCRDQPKPRGAHCLINP
jgi:hypothetical protein